MELMNAQKKTNLTLGKTGTLQFVVRGQSDVFPGAHYLNIYGGVLPAQGAYGRLTEKRGAK
jgi:hypothetical protein